jgi:hypothetical protein
VFQFWSIFWVVHSYPDYATPTFFAMGALQTSLFLISAMTVAFLMHGRNRTKNGEPGWLLSE